jgi:sugar lactone lactonase YvrE
VRFHPALVFSVYLLTSVVVASCGSGVNGSSGYGVESGVAQKGPLLQGSEIFVSELGDEDLQPTGRTYLFQTNDNLGRFSAKDVDFESPYLSTVAQGYYYNEITGSSSSDLVFLRGLSDIHRNIDTAINVNALSSVVVNRILNLATGRLKIDFQLARSQAQREVLDSLFIYNSQDILSGLNVGGVVQPSGLTSLDLSRGRAGDQILAAVSGIVMTAGASGSGVNTLLSEFENDIADDGYLNNSTNYPVSVSSLLCAAASSTDFAKVAANLNSFYGTAYVGKDLSQWVDTSGCVDQVIDKYKYYVKNAVVGVENKSPGYMVGGEDAGQCLSVDSGVLYLNGTPIRGGAVGVVKGDVVVMGGTLAVAGTSSQFLRRSPRLPGGGCPGLAPSSGLTRVAKFTISAPVVISGIVSTLAGSGAVGSLNGQGSAASFNNPSNVAVDALGNVYVADTTNNLIRKISPVGVVTNFAGSGAAGSADGPAGSATFNAPIGIAVDATGNVFVADSLGQLIRKITPDGVVSTFAGSGNRGSGDAQGRDASFNNPLGISFDSAGNLYVADAYNGRIRKVTPSGMVSTLATGFSYPWATAVDGSGNVYVTDPGASRIYKVTSGGGVTSLAGSGSAGFADGTGSAAMFNNPLGIVLDTAGNIYVGDDGNRRLRKISSTGVVVTLAGSGISGSSDGTGVAASFNRLAGIALDSGGSLYVADPGANLIRKIN